MAAGSISGIRGKPSTAGPRSSWAVGGSAVHFDRPTNLIIHKRRWRKKPSPLTNATLASRKTSARRI